MNALRRKSSAFSPLRRFSKRTFEMQQEFDYPGSRDGFVFFLHAQSDDQHTAHAPRTPPDIRRASGEWPSRVRIRHPGLLRAVGLNFPEQINQLRTRRCTRKREIFAKGRHGELMATEQSFHMTPDEFRRHGHAVVDWIADYIRVSNRSQCFAGRAGSNPSIIAPRSPAKANHPGHAGDIEKLILPGITHWQSPNFFAFFPPILRARESSGTSSLPG